MQRLLSAFGLLSIVAGLLVPTGALAQRDHYNEYDFEQHPTVPVSPFVLTDQWGTSQHTLAVLDRFLVPTEQDADPILDPDLFLTKWFIGPGGEPPRGILVSNKFGPKQPWTIGQSSWLLNPSIKNPDAGQGPPIANHYKCYEADGPIVDDPVVLVDQFGSYKVIVAEPAMWCNPARKQIEDQVFDIVDPQAWLGCYFTVPASTFAPPLPVVILDQFAPGLSNFLISREIICVPSLKMEPVPTETLTWGGIKAVYR